VNVKTSRWRAVPTLMGVAALACSMLIVGPSVVEAASTHVAVSAAGPLADHVSATAARKLSTDSSARPAVIPMTDTPDGYKLIHPGYRRSNYVYDSDWVYQGDYRCSGGECSLQAETRLKIHEYVYGGSSHYWSLRYDAQTVKNPGHLSWQFHDRYYCGVNVAHHSDPICTNGASASGKEYAFNPGESFRKTWGRTNSITVFPMVALSTHFSTGVVVTTKFRGWDTLSRTRTTRLNTTSGTGN
jgi:hypothetical protein